MKKIIAGFIAVLVILGFLIISGPFVISSDVIGAKLTAKLESLTGKKVTFESNIKLSYIPYMGLQVSSLKLTDDQASEGEPAFLEVEQVNTQIELLPLLTGRIELSEFTLLRPKLNLKTTTGGVNNWTSSQGEISRAISTTSDNRLNNTENDITQATLGSLDVKDGIITYNNLIDDSQEQITNINGTLSWPAIDNSTSISSNGIWRGELFTLTAEIADPLEIISGGESNIDFEIDSQPIVINFSGMANMLSNLFISGDIETSTPSIKRLAETFGFDAGDQSDIQNWNASGKLEASATKMDLTDGVFTVGDNSATGILQLINEENLNSKLIGTLAFEEINLPFYFERIKGTNDFKPISIKNLDVDLRLSTQTLNLGSITLEDVAASIILNESGWNFDIGNSTSFDGIVTAKFGQSIRDSSRQSFLNIKTDNINIGNLLQTTLGEKELSVTGEGNFKTNLRTNSLEGDFLNLELNGDVDGTITSGSLIGIDLPAILNQNETIGELELEGFDKTKITPFDSLQTKFFLNKGIANLAQTELTIADQIIRLSGKIDLQTGDLNLQAQEVKEGIPQLLRLQISGKPDKLKTLLFEVPKQTN